MFSVEDIMQCNDTVEGVCTTGNTLEECINTCTGDCQAGYYISFSNGQSICAPIRTAIKTGRDPIYRVRTKNEFPDLADVDSTVFINSNTYPFPPDEANAVFYMDLMRIKVVGTNLLLDNEQLTATTQLNFSNNQFSRVQLIPTGSFSGMISQYESIHYGQGFLIISPGTSLVAYNDPKDKKLKWVIAGPDLEDEKYVFRFLADEEGDKGKKIAYKSQLKISNGNIILGVNKTTKTLVADNKNAYELFTLTSDMRGSYCYGKNCKGIAINDTTTDGVKASYNNSLVVRRSDCFGVCGNMYNNKLELQDHPPRVKPLRWWVFGVIAASVFVLASIILIVYYIHLYRVSHK
jgi:hypothetical protein